MKLSKEFILEMIKTTISEEELGLGIDEPEAPPPEEMQQQNAAFLEQTVAKLEGISDFMDSNSEESILSQLTQMTESLQSLYPDLEKHLTSVVATLGETVEEISIMIQKTNEVLKGMQDE